MAEVKPSTSRGEDPVGIVGESSCSRADGSTYPESVPPSIVAKSPSFFKRLWIRIQTLTACSGVWGARGGGLSGPRVGLTIGAQHTQENNEWEVLSRIVASKSTQEDSESEVMSRIAASKSTWSEVPGHDIHHPVSIPCPSTLSVWEELQASAPDFFLDWGNIFEVGRLIAEGGQAQIFEAKLRRWEHLFVLKIFKLDAGFSLADFKRHWPCSMRNDSDSDSSSMEGRSSRFLFEDPHGARCDILSATLLKNGRFAFLMDKYWGDLRTFIDQRVKGIPPHPLEMDLMSAVKRSFPLFSYDNSIHIMLQIARGMQELHAKGVLHRDLKAANVLVGDPKECLTPCFVADYECAMFVQGTGFWRAPEVLQELQKREEEDRNGDIWTEKVDVYSFGMTCYEVLTGQIPFAGYTKSKWGDVIRGERPSFEVIIGELSSLREERSSWI